MEDIGRGKEREKERERGKKEGRKGPTHRSQLGRFITTTTADSFVSRG